MRYLVVTLVNGTDVLHPADSETYLKDGVLRVSRYHETTCYPLVTLLSWGRDDVDQS